VVLDSLLPNQSPRRCHQIEAAINSLLDWEIAIADAYTDVDTAIARVCAAERGRDAAKQRLQRLVAHGDVV